MRIREALPPRESGIPAGAVFSICRSYGAHADFEMGSYQDFAPTELQTRHRFNHRLGYTTKSVD